MTRPEEASNVSLSRMSEESGSFSETCSQYFKEFEEKIVQKIDKWPFRPDYRLFRPISELQSELQIPTYPRRLYNEVLKYNVIPMERHGRLPLFGNRDVLRAFGALNASYVFISQGVGFDILAKEEIENVTSIIDETREWLEKSHPQLVDFIRDQDVQVLPQESVQEEIEEEPGNTVTAPVELDFTGLFWGTPLGEAVKEFYEDKVKNKGLLSSLGSSNVAQILVLNFGSNDHGLISGLVRAGILAGVERDRKRYVFRPEHIVVSGLILLHLERGYSREDALNEVQKLLSDTEFRQFVGDGVTKHDEILGRTHNFFDVHSSSWLSFPLDPAKKREPKKVSLANYPRLSKFPKRLSADDGFSKQPEDISKEQGNPPVYSSGRGGQVVFEDQRLLAVEARVDLQSQNPLERIPKIEKNDLKNMEGYDKMVIENLLTYLPNSSDTVNFIRDLPYHIVRAIMFIVEVDNHTVVRYDPNDEEYPVISVKSGLKLCYDYIKAFPEKTDGNLAGLFMILRNAYSKEPKNYWNSPREKSRR